MKDILSKQYMSIVRYIEILIVVLLIPLLYNYVPIDKEAASTLYIDGSNIDTVVTSLEENDYTVTLVDKIMMQVEALPQSGWYTLNKEKYGRYNFFKTLHAHRAKTMDVVIYAGETHDELIDRLANDLKLEKKKLYESYKTLTKFKEAEIFSGHYQIARKAKEQSVMHYLFHISQKILDIFVEKTFTHKPDHFELKVLLTMASIIQKESNDVKEMPLISSVIYNRLHKEMKLQMDSTLNYGPYSHRIVTPERIKSDTSRYNTYKHKGLPPYPLGTISLNALRAAKFPAKNKYLFFMLKPDGGHQFAESYEDHLENIRIFRAYQKKREEKKKQEEKQLEEKQQKKEKKKEQEKKKAALSKKQTAEQNSTKESNTSKKKALKEEKKAKKGS